MLRLGKGAHCSVYKPEVILDSSSFIVNCRGVDIEHCQAQNIMIPVSDSVAMVGTCVMILNSDLQEVGIMTE